MSDLGTDAMIQVLLGELRLPTVRKLYKKVAKEIASQGGDYASYLHALLDEEVCHRRNRRVERRTKEARFRQEKLLSELDAKSLPTSVKIEHINELASGAYIESAMNIIAIGNSGTGKTHVSVGLGLEACRQGRRVRFFTATELTCELEEAQEQHSLHRYLRRFAKWDLVIIDELGYLPISESAAELLFQALSERHERSSVIINSNMPFGEWPKIFKSERLAVALLDRLTHRAHILEMNGASYRLASAKSKQAQKGASVAP